LAQYIFISYVSEDSNAAARIAEGLRAFGILVWRDRDALRAGDRWKDAVREAISRGTAFLCCFSKNSEIRERSYMREELLLAVEELRLRSTTSTWFIPVLLDGTLPSYDFQLAPSLCLSDIQYVDLSKDWDHGITEIVTAMVSRYQPEERANLQGRLDVAESMEKLATSESILLSNTRRALSLASSAERVPLARATAYFDHVEETFWGLHSLFEISETASHYGAIHLASNSLAISGPPHNVAWGARGGYVAAASLSTNGATLLGQVGENIPDVLIFMHGTRVGAI
jgi:hypothetical protein